MEHVRLGTRILHPDRQLLAGDKRLHLGKRALRILSVLADARGEVVTKRELLEAVWPNITVEENALPVHVVALRKALGPEAVRLETVHGIGYRLAIDEQVESPPAPAARQPVTLPARPIAWRIAAPLAAIVIALVVLGFSIMGQGERPIDIDGPVYVERPEARGGKEAQLVALDIDGAIKDAISTSGFALGGPDADGNVPDDATKILHTTLTRSGGNYAAYLSLDDESSGKTLWSRSFEADAKDGRRLAEQAGASVARTIYAMREVAQQRGLSYDAATMALHLRGSESLRNRQLDNDSASEIFRQVVARYPDSAPAHGLLAVALHVDTMASAPELRRGILDEIRREANAAIAIDPKASGAAYDALTMVQMIEKPDDLTGYERSILRGIAAAPDFAFLQMRECRFLSEIGFEYRAAEYCRRATALHPYAEPILHSYARALAASNDPNRAAQFIDRAAYLFPDHVHIQRTRFELALFGGRRDLARNILDDPESRPAEIGEDQMNFWRDFIGSYGQRDGRQAEGFDHRIVALVHDGALSVDWAVLALTSLGRTQRALDLLTDPALVSPQKWMNTQVLFQPLSEPLRSDPRFWTFAARMGLVRYWQEKGEWPDFCRRELTVQECRTQARIAQAALAPG
ncbi:winged helix-turn-helix domain-containing protein [Qipengyuania sp. RANM35]|uniref:winged helix-turn-helix domain-containing protein n=1 Tax=Qipengyuania sp. RANM35 TaxID=3068635 RepID=UPI0034DB25A4